MRTPSESGPEPRLHGSYWTDRATQGEMDFSRVSRKRVADFAEAQGLAQQGSQ